MKGVPAAGRAGVGATGSELRHMGLRQDGAQARRPVSQVDRCTECIDAPDRQFRWQRLAILRTIQIGPPQKTVQLKLTSADGLRKKDPGHVTSRCS